MLKYMLTHDGSNPRHRETPKAVKTRLQSVECPRPPSAMEDYSAVESPTLASLSRANRRVDSNGTRPVSVHGSVANNCQVIYANAPFASTIGKQFNNSQSAPNTSRLNASLNANLNLSNLNSSSTSPGTLTNQTKSSHMDSSRDQSHHDLNTTQISPIARSLQQLRSQSAQQQNYLNATALSANGDVRRQRLRSGSGNSNSNTNSTMLHQSMNGGLNMTNGIGKRLNATLVPANVSKFMMTAAEAGVKEMITSLGLLCVVSLLLALLSLVFLFKMTPGTSEASAERVRKYAFLTEEEFVVVYEVTLALCALTLSLNLCCLLVCAIQFLFAVKLVKTSQGRTRTNKYLKEASVTRTCAIGGFFVSIPVFLTGIILYTFLHFDSTPAIVTSVLIGLGIVFCGAAVVHNVFIWQKEKMSSLSSGHVAMTRVLDKRLDRSSKSGFGLPQATHDLSGPNASVSEKELSTLV